MDAARFFLLRYEPLHAMITDRLFAGLSEAQLRARPQGQNSIVWNFWHVARAEDVGINRFAGDRREVFDEGGWESRLGVKTLPRGGQRARSARVPRTVTAAETEFPAGGMGGAGDAGAPTCVTSSSTSRPSSLP